MATHPMVLLVEPDPMLRALIHGELADEGCIVVDAATGKEALAFAEVYPGPIDLAVTDLVRPGENAQFARALRELPTGTDAKIACLPALFDRNDLVRTCRRVMPTQTGLDAHDEEGDGAVFWGAVRRTDQTAALPTAVNA